MDSTTVATMTQLLDELGARFGATGTHLWGELVAYQVAGAWVGVVMPVAVVAVCVAVALAIVHWGLGRDGNDGWLAEEISWLLLGLCAIAALAGVFVFVEGFGALVQTIVSPEAATVHSLLGK